MEKMRGSMSSGYSDVLDQQVIGSILISCIGESEYSARLSCTRACYQGE